jgi:hypothetical protein
MGRFLNFFSNRRREIRDSKFMVGQLCKCGLKSVRRITFSAKQNYWGCHKGVSTQGGCGFFLARKDNEKPAPRPGNK